MWGEQLIAQEPVPLMYFQNPVRANLSGVKARLADTQLFWRGVAYLSLF